ncbi:MAG: hypothetical protein ACRDVM_09045, partial [Acidimicrobiia bacterium]
MLRVAPGDPISYTGAGRLGSGVFTGEVVERGEESAAPRAAPAIRMAVAPPRRRELARFVVE